MSSAPRITLDDIFHVACELPPDQRSVYLDDVCADNETLRHEIEGLLAYDNPHNDFLNKHAIEVAAKQIATAQPVKPPVPSRLGTTVENFKILAPIGKGAMGEVFLARDLDLKIDVAIKFLPEAYVNDPEWQARFDREGHLAASLNHSNIASVRRKGQVNGQPFLVLEFVEGETLEEKLQAGPLSIQEALPIFRQLADALAFAHRRRIIHRDLKPSNLKITSENILKVLDFGIAKRISTDLSTLDLKVQENGDAPTRGYGETRPGEVIGTIAYMSPEQTRGWNLDQRTDIWSFGCVFYESLTGHLPFRGVDRYDTLNLIRNPEIKPDWNALPAQTPAMIVELLHRCLEKEASARLDNMQDALAILIQSSGSANVLPQKDAPKPWLAIVSVSLMLMLSALIVLYREPIFSLLMTGKLTASTPEPPIGRRYLVILPFKESGANESSQMGRTIAEGLREVLKKAPELKVITQNNSSRLLANADPGRLFRRFGANLLLKGDVETSNNEVTIRYQVHDQRTNRFSVATVKGSRSNYHQLSLNLAKSVATILPVTISFETLQTDFSNPANEEKYLLALAYLRSDLTKETVEQPIGLLRELAVTESQSTRVWAALANAYLSKAQVTNDPNAKTLALSACQQALRLNANANEAQTTLGHLLVFLNSNDKAVETFARVLEKSPDDLEALLGLGEAYNNLNRFDDAEHAYCEAVRRWPNYWASHNELGAFYFSMGRNNAALREWQEVIRLAPDSPTGDVNLGNYHFNDARYDEAKHFYRQSIEKAPTPEAYAGLGTALYYQSQYNDAANAFLEGIALQSNVATLWGNLGDAYRHISGKESDGVNAYNRAIALFGEQLQGRPIESSETARLAEWHAKRGVITSDANQKAADTQKALALIQQALRQNALDSNTLLSAISTYHLTDQQAATMQWVKRAFADELLTPSVLEHDADFFTLVSRPEYLNLVAARKNASQ